MKRMALFTSLVLVLFGSPVAIGQDPDPDGGAKSDRMRRSGGAPAGQGRQPMRGRQSMNITVADPDEFAGLQAEAIFSGPQPTEKVPPFKARPSQGDAASETVDPSIRGEGKPHVMIFQEGSGVGLRGLVGFSRLLETINQSSETRLVATAVLLGDDPNELAKTADRLKPHASADLKIMISVDGREGPGTLGLNRNVALTILMVKDGVVKRNFAMTQAMLRPDPHVLGGVAELIGVERETLAGWLANDAQPMRRSER